MSCCINIISLFIKQTFDVTIQRHRFQEMLMQTHRIESNVQTEQCIVALCMQLVTTLGLHKKRKTPANKNTLRILS